MLHVEGRKIQTSNSLIYSEGQIHGGTKYVALLWHLVNGLPEEVYDIIEQLIAFIWITLVLKNRSFQSRMTSIYFTDILVKNRITIVTVLLISEYILWGQLLMMYQNILSFTLYWQKNKRWKYKESQWSGPESNYCTGAFSTICDLFKVSECMGREHITWAKCIDF